MYSVSPDNTIAKARELVNEKKGSGFPIVEARRLVGIIIQIGHVFADNRKKG